MLPRRRSRLVLQMYTTSRGFSKSSPDAIRRSLPEPSFIEFCRSDLIIYHYSDDYNAFSDEFAQSAYNPEADEKKITFLLTFKNRS